MATNHQHRPTNQQDYEQLYFVGRRTFGTPEFYVVTTTHVERLRSQQRFGATELDWQALDHAAIELAHSVLTRLVGETPSEHLAARLAVDIISELPYDGFVLNSQAIWLWFCSTTEPEDWSPAMALP
jgi:hypothetical protein